MLLKDPSPLYERVLVFYGEGWHHGVIGIIASRLVERFGKPVFIMSDGGDADDEDSGGGGVQSGEVRGSARAFEGFSVYTALHECSALLDKFGGHVGAGGFSLKKENVESFAEKLQRFAECNTADTEEIPVYSLRAEKVMPPEEMTEQAVRDIELLEPFGEGNKRPLLAFPAVRIGGVIPLSDGMHTKLQLIYGGKTVSGLLFGVKTAEFPYKAGDVTDILAYAELNEYNGTVSVNLRIEDIRLSGFPIAKYFAAKDAYERFKRGEGIIEKLRPRVIPQRDELAEVFRALPKGVFVNCDAVFSVLARKINYCKFRLALDIFEELGLLRLNRFYNTAQLSENQRKVSLEDSEIFRRLSTELAFI